MEYIGKYIQQKLLGEGSTSIVYLCHDAFAQRDVAIKVIKPDVLHSLKQNRVHHKQFAIEASLAGKLNHPHIAKIYDAVNEGEQPYLVVEYVAGGTLEQFCKPDRLLPAQRVVEVIFKCARALEFAQSIGITHRDIKPANILVENTDASLRNIKITDFGTALTGSEAMTVISGIGSPAYMSPEQLKDQALDHRTDIYSLGVVLFQLLTGRLPFEASNPASVTYQIINIAAPKPSTFNHAVPPGLDAMVAKALQKNVAQRYQTWGEFSSDLAALFRDGSTAVMTNEQIADSEKFTSLRALRFFKPFADPELWEVVRISEWDKHAPGSVLLKENDHGDFFYIIAAGQVKAVKSGKLLNVIEAGDCVGEMAYLTPEDNVRSADVITLGATTTLKLSNCVLKNASVICQQHFDRAFLNILVERLAHADERIARASSTYKTFL